MNPSTQPPHLQKAIAAAMEQQYPSSPRRPSKSILVNPPPAAPAKRNGRSSIFEQELEYAMKMKAEIPAFECNAEIIPGRKFEFDFVWRKQRVALELEGGVWRRGGGAHSHPSNILRDLEKSNLAALEGYRLLRFTTDQHRRGEIVPFLINFFRAIK